MLKFFRFLGRILNLATAGSVGHDARYEAYEVREDGKVTRKATIFRP